MAQSGDISISCNSHVFATIQLPNPKQCRARDPEGTSSSGLEAKDNNLPNDEGGLERAQGQPE